MIVRITKLFSHVHEGRATPVHRHVAEYLGARHLASLIEDGLPSGRVLALMTGPDGMVVTQLRGLSAWLASHSRHTRVHFIERDPVGVGLYGDITTFSTDEKRSLLAALCHEPRQLTSAYSMVPAFASLATPAMSDALQDILADDVRDDHHQLTTNFVVNLLAKTRELPRLAPVLLDLVRDPTRQPYIKEPALRGYIGRTDKGENIAMLKDLLADLEASRIDDPDEELLGTVLKELYPNELSPSRVWRYLREGSKLFGGPYWWFWNDELHEPRSPWSWTAGGSTNPCPSST